MPKPPTAERGRRRREPPVEVAPRRTGLRERAAAARSRVRVTSQSARARPSARLRPPSRRRRLGSPSALRTPRGRSAAGTEPRKEWSGTSWRPYATSAICVAGLGVSIYLTLTHYTSVVPLVCATSGAVNCEAVTTSAESVVFGIPVAVLGIAFFVPMLLLCLPFAWRSGNHLVAAARLLGVVTGIGFVAYLLYAELFEIRKICLWCTSVHVLTFLLFAIVVTGWDDATRWRGDRARDGGALA